MTTRIDFVLSQAVACGMLAPSRFDTRPWSLKLHGESIELRLDRARALPVVDPVARELIMSCGAALENIELALRHSGYDPQVALFPSGSNPDLLARVELGPRREPTPFGELVYAQIRRPPLTDRTAPVAVHAHLLSLLEGAAESTDAWLRPVTEAEQREIVSELVAESVEVRAGDWSYRREVAGILRTASSMRPPRRRWSALPVSLTPAVVRWLPWGGTRARRAKRLVREAPLLAVLGTRGDTPRDWIAAGAALQLVRLVAAAKGVVVTSFNEPVEVAGQRLRLRDAIRTSGFPQLVLRIGFATKSRGHTSAAMGAVVAHSRVEEAS